MSAAILGAGNVGRALASRLGAIGVPVRFGVRDPGSAAGALAPAMTPAEAVAPASVVFLAVPAAVAVEVAGGAGALAGKVLVDCTNPLRWEEGPVWAPPPEGSVAAALAAALPGVAVVKGFNHFGAEIHADPHLGAGPADALFAGDEPEAKGEVMELAGRMGFRPHDAGPLRNAALLENLAILWIHLATKTGQGRQFAFQIAARA